MRKAYTAAQKVEAIALAAVIGSKAAGKQLGIDWRTIRGWSGLAGSKPADAIEQATWQSLADLSIAKVQALVAAGKLRPVELATTAAIATRNASKEAKPLEVESSVAARDRFDDWIYEQVTDEDWSRIHAELPFTDDDLRDDAAAERVIDAAVERASEVIDSVRVELLDRANAELPDDRREHNPEGSHRLALLAWHNGRQDVPAGDILEWAQAQVLSILAEYETLTAFAASARAERHRERLIRDRAYVLFHEGGMQSYPDAIALATELTP